MSVRGRGTGEGGEGGGVVGKWSRTEPSTDGAEGGGFGEDGGAGRSGGGGEVIGSVVPQ